MEERKNLCAQIPVSLHAKVREAQEESGQSLSNYITEVLTIYYENGGNTMSETRTLAIQVTEKFYQQIKRHLKMESERRGKKLSQKEFIMQALLAAMELSAPTE